MRVTLRHVAFAYGALPVLEDVSLDVAAGETVALIGPSGCGKSTLLNLVGGLLPPQQREILKNESEGIEASGRGGAMN